LSVWTIIVAAGTGARFGGRKQFEPLGGRLVVDWSIETALAASDGVVVVLPADAFLDAPTTGGDRLRNVAGGSTRSASVRRGLAAIPEDAEVVLVHDGARPFASVDLYRRTVAAVRAGAVGVIPGMVVTDTIKRVDADSVVLETVDRTPLRAVQTPQAFDAVTLRAAYADDPDATDDAAVLEATGHRVVVIEGEPDNRKITTPSDLDWARGHAMAAGWFN
jgi:2-C-methyl-D-erythritol 4-phosphate cytidylyltransferase